MNIGTPGPISDAIDGTDRPRLPVAADAVIAYVRRLIESGRCKPGDRLPPERQLVGLIGVSRPSVRTGLHALAAIGVVEARQGSGTFITDAPPVFASVSLQFLAALHGISNDQLFEVRRILEADVAALAAARATGDQLAAISEEVMEMFAVREEPRHFLIHDIRFHRAVARAAGNSVLAALVEMVAEVFFEQRKDSVFRWQGAPVAAEHHKRIYQAIRDRDPEGARHEMDVHLRWAERVQRVDVETLPAGEVDESQGEGVV